MKKIHFSGSDLLEDISIISGELKGDLVANGGCAYTKFSNDLGKGVITCIRVSDEISSLVFDLVFNTEVEFEYSNKIDEFIDLFFCLEGSVFHKIDSESNYKKINFRQNTLVKRLKGSKNTLSFPASTPLKMSFISYSLSPSSLNEKEEYQNIRDMASNSLKEIKNGKNPRHHGRICFRTSDYVQKIMPVKFENAPDILFKEAAILNTLASQIDRYDKDTKGKYANAPIKQYELDKILAVSNFIQQNLTENLAVNNLVSISGLAASKLQAGFNYLFGTTVNGYVTQKRLEKAAELIELAEMNISQIVYYIGFSSRSYFSKIFKRRYGLSPSEALNRPVIN